MTKYTIGQTIRDEGFEGEVIDVQENGEWLFGKVFAVTVRATHVDPESYAATTYGRKAGDVYTFDARLSLGDLA